MRDPRAYAVQVTPRRVMPSARLAGFADDAQAAMQASPGYFTWWYTAKSIALVGAIGVAAFFAGLAKGRGGR